MRRTAVVALLIASTLFLGAGLASAAGGPSPRRGHGQAQLLNHDRMMAETPPDDGHRKNILNGNLHKVGIGVYRVPDKKAYYVSDFTD